MPERRKFLRLGVALPPRKTAIFDAIKAAGDVGISSSSLRVLVWREQKRCRHNVKVHIAQLNVMIANTGHHIIAEGRGPHSLWFLVKRKIGA
jgi:hypothetical protein